MNIRRIFGILLVLIMICAGMAATADGGYDPFYQPSYSAVGSIFTYGSFEQDGDPSNGPEPILWRVLDVDYTNGWYLALSEYGLWTMNYHHSNEMTAWGDTDVRNWLNGSFAVSAFTADELSAVVFTRVSGSTDRFFLLDPYQVQRYLQEPYYCFATQYAINCGAYVNEQSRASSWLVRTDTAQQRIAWIGGGGKLYLPSGSRGINYLTSGDNVVRPAMWIDMNRVDNNGSTAVGSAGVFR